MSAAKHAPKPKSRKPQQCPNPKKGERCKVCGGEWVCLRSDLPKAKATGQEGTKDQQ